MEPDDQPVAGRGGVPGRPAETATVLRAAAQAGLRVAPQATGYNAGPLGELNNAVLLRTSAMTGISIDAATRRTRVAAGARWLDVVAAAAPHGLAALHSVAPGDGVVGYSLGGGIGWYARALGLQSNSLTAVELVTADGVAVRCDAEHDRDLFWALRGGGGNFGVVTAVEFDLYPLPSAYAGALAWDLRHATRVLARWAEWAAVDAPQAATTSFQIVRTPAISGLAESCGQRELAIVQGCVLAGSGQAESVLAPLRELRPDMDTFAHVPPLSVARLQPKLDSPMPIVSESAMLASLPPLAIDAFWDAAGSDSGSSLVLAELRHLGGALAQAPHDAGALPYLDGRFLLLAMTAATTAEEAARGRADAGRLAGMLSRYTSGAEYLNFTARRADVSAGYPAEGWTRLRTIREAVDPNGLFMANHPIPPDSA
jgi:FAD/FMN-containing dehydrogenase